MASKGERCARQRARTPALVGRHGAHAHGARESRYRAAAEHARRVIPGPLGELAARELRAHADFGYGLNHDGLIPRLSAVVLAMRTDSPAGSPGAALDSDLE